MASTSADPRSYVDFEPRLEWLKGKESDTIIVDVSGFKKEQLKVLINTAGNLKISGERLIEGNHWSRFLRSFTVPKNINLKGIQAKFDGNEGLLYVILPISLSSVPELITPPLPTKAQENSSEGTRAHQEASFIGGKEAPKMQEKEAAEEEEKERNSGEKSAEDYKEDINTLESGRKGSLVASVINKRKLVILSVIFGVMVALGLAVYLSYRSKGL
ncbi:inactive protein RESTRICTED TEV MOVEMENT 2-like [Phalaenopsis equestris]|uniref:inactive protein RESTRICTED TEV MOVEMENT 2-like n=1 Tax=Phalaenopsis equestris TaxID=78828 RepID=UPI0009E32944|nr:inactive protein RESTRICTED TEV MOVEMENT 2-like [Phalaenopsis equestris]